jgi:uncharacterized protein (TIGR00297 family)
VDRLLNYAFGIVIIYLFVLFAGAEEHMQILLGLAAAMLISITGFLLSWLTLDGAQASFIAGITAFGLGGLPAAILVLSFFITGTLLTQMNDPSYEDIYGDAQPVRRRRRDGIQVWANNFWFALNIVLWFMFESDVWLVTAVATLAIAMADTWATEIGYRISLGSTYSLKGWRKVQPGTDGGVSLSGSLGGLSGGMIIGLLGFLVFPEISLHAGLFIAIIGFLGTYLDSMLGAYFQYEGRSLDIPWLSVDGFSLDNNGVNWVATGLGSITSLILIQFISIT